MNRPTVALCLIVKHDEAKLLDTCLASVAEHVDGVFLYINYPKSIEQTKEAVEIAKKYKVTYVVKEWTNFGDARNKNFAQVPEDYEFIVWCDTDDTWENPEKLHQVAAATPNHISGVYMSYDYQHDEFGNVTVQHYVARMVRNNGTFAWSKKILHETLEPTRHAGKAMNQEVHVIHHADGARRDASLLRNVEMLEKELRKEGDNPDPRTLYYLGTTLIDIGRTDESKELLNHYLQMSGWAEERAQAFIYLGNIFYDEGNSEEARACYIHAISENPKDAGACVELAKLEMRDEMWDKAIEWLTVALAKKNDPMTTTTFSTETRYRAYMYLSDCYLSQGGQSIDKALKYAQKALEMRPDETTRAYYDNIEEVIEQRDMAKGVVIALSELEKSEQKANIPTLIDNLPISIQDNPAILRFKKRFTEAKIWPKKSIVIFCGNSVLGEWGPWSLEEGIGGSEEAVIRLSAELTKLEYQVTVYGNPGVRAGHYDGIEWRNYWELNLADTFDVFIGWRMPWFFDIKMKARKKYLWLHDVMEKEEFTKERLENLDKVIVLSKYHRSLFPMIPDNKIFLSANGITPEDFEREDSKYKRDPRKVIYMSSHVRGLDMLYEAWPDVKKAVPEASLDIYYGWGSYDAVNRGNPERMAWKEKMQAKLKTLKDVIDHGKVSQNIIIEKIQQAGVAAYPCPFPEISCISMMKAQAGGAIPVTSNFAALEETVQWGIKIPMKEMRPNTPVGQWDEVDLGKFIKALIRMLKNPNVDRAKMMAWSRKNQSWLAVAKTWNREFNE